MINAYWSGFYWIFSIDSTPSSTNPSYSSFLNMDSLPADVSTSTMTDLEKKALERKRRLEEMKKQSDKGSSNGANADENSMEKREYAR